MTIRPRASGLGGFLLAAGIGTLLSMVRTGHVSGMYNNFYHLPILAGLTTMPQFADDPFIQSLPYYASAFWRALVGIAPADAAFPLLLTMAVASRFLALVGFLACADAIGIRDVKGRLLFAVLIALSRLMNGTSVAGDGGLFINYFTHSEVANATTLLAIWCAARGRFTAACAFNGATFFLNAFMAVWNAVPLGLIAILLLARHEIDWRTLARRMAVGLLAFLILAAPAIHLIVANPEFGRPIDFDYPTYLTQFYPIHFLVTEVSPRDVAVLGVIAMSGSLAALVLAQREPRAAFCLVALLGFVLLWLAGAVLPFLTRSPELLNLHLLRAGAGIHLFAALALVGLTTSWARGPSRAERRIWAPALAITCEISHFLLPIAILVIALHRFAPRLPLLLARQRLDLAAAVLLMLVALPLQIARQARSDAALRDDIATWHALGQWANANTQVNAVFLIPVDDFYRPTHPAADSTQAKLATGYEVFETFAERRVWVDDRSGAAVMWNPSYYHRWHDRLADVNALPDHDARIKYARARGINFIIDGCWAETPALVRWNERCVYSVDGAVAVAD